MKVAITGGSGLVGRALAARLAARGDTVVRLVRRAAGPGEARWDPHAGTVDDAALVGCSAIVHLAGENIGAGRWSAARKARIVDSRVEGTRTVAALAARLEPRPRVLVSASAVGWYGDAGERTVDEDEPPGTGFLAAVCRDWEAALAPAHAAGVRCVALRIGVVLAREGGALARMLTPFRLGLGGPIGSGRQWMSWIAREDLLAALAWAIDCDVLRGPVNAVAPQPVTQREFARTLGSVLHRPALAPLPAAIVRLAFGEMGQALLLEGCRALPTRLAASGFRFAHPALRDALTAELRRG